MTALRRRMLEDLQLRGLAPKTQQCYVEAVKHLAQHCRRAPDQISAGEIRQYFLYLINEKQVTESTRRIHLYGIRFFYEHTLQRPWPVFELIRPRHRQKLPVVLSPQEVRSLLALVQCSKARMCLQMIYACGLRLREGTQLQVADIDPQRMLVRVRQGKGGKDRVVPLAERTLELLRLYWQRARPRPWLFPARDLQTPLPATTLQKTFKLVVRQSCLAKDASVHTLRHSYATHLLERGVSLRVVIFTLPDELRTLWLENVQLMTQLLFVTVRATLCELLGDGKYLGARPGIIATLHTWSQTLVLHPHLHCLVTGGGVTDQGEWRAVRNGFLLPVRVVMAVFRGKLLAALDTAVHEGTLTLPDGMAPRHWATLRHKLGRQKWNVHIRERYPHGAEVLTYLARYIRGGPIANERLVACEQGVVTFRYRLNGEGAGGEPTSQGRMRVSIEEFIRRYLLHVPPSGMRVVRSYGLYAATKREALASCREQLGQGPMAEPVVLDWQAACRERGEAHPERCPRCGHLLVRLGVILPARIPPSEDTEDTNDARH